MSSTLPKYDVFLSFRGFDTRRHFTSFLYKELTRKNIRTFKDDQELTSGQRISPELENAIKDSKFAVVVVSVNYAASTWCLDELVKIMDFQKQGSLTVMPIFYDVDPCHVRWQIGVLAEQFKKHEARKDCEKVPVNLLSSGLIQTGSISYQTGQVTFGLTIGLLQVYKLQGMFWAKSALSPLQRKEEGT